MEQDPAHPSSDEPFIQPEQEELGIPLSPDPQSGEQVDAEALLAARLEDFKQRWDALGELDVEALLTTIKDGIAEHPSEQRELLITWIAIHTGLARRKVKPRNIERGALLWDLLDPKRFDALSEDAHEALLAIAKSTHPNRPTLHPLAATAAIALWHHKGEESDEAREILAGTALPDDLDWLIQVVRRLDVGARKKSKGSRPRDLIALAKLQLESSFWNATALLAGLSFVNRYGRWSPSKPAYVLTQACDRVAIEFPHREAAWIEVLSDAVMGGELTHPWVERLMSAAIRLAIDDEGRERALRAHHARKPYEAEHARLFEIYSAQAETWSRAREGREPADFLLAEAKRLETSNPTRAQRLLEIAMVERVLGTRGHTAHRKIKRALETLDIEKDSLALEHISRLLGFYVKNYEIDPCKARFVHRWSKDERIRQQLDAEELELYLLIGDYERAFQHLTCKYDGVKLHHADKHAATRVKYFIEKRVQPGSMTKMVDAAFSPVEWLGATMGDMRLIHHAVERGLLVFEARINSHDMRDTVLEEFRETGAPIEHFEQIGNLSIDHVEALLRSRRSKRLLLGALAGGISGGLAPLGWGVISLADIPVILGITADICGRFCWYYGFDPRDDRELPMEILAVALGGSRPAAIQPMLLRQNLREFAVQKSLVVGALSKGAINQAAGRAINQLFEAQLSPRLAGRARDIARRAVQRNFEQRAASAAPGKALPWVGALLGAALNAALIYDLCEAAQAVLTDRFLERKYPDWTRHFALDSAARAGSEEE